LVFVLGFSWRLSYFERVEFVSQHNKNSNTQVKRLFSQEYKSLLRYGLQVSANESLVEDSIQDLFLKFCENENLIIGIRNQNSYLRVSLKREIVHKLEKLNKEEGPRMVDIAVPSYEQKLIQNQSNLQDTVKIKAGLASLSPSQKTVITLRFYKGMSYQEIADKLGTSKRTVYNQVHDAVKRMRKSMPK